MSTPTDWGAVASAIAAGVAAIVGVLGTTMQARQDRSAASTELEKRLQAQTELLQDRNTAVQNRAIYAQKMRIYATFQGAVGDLLAVAGPGEQQEGFGKAYSAMLRAAAEVELVASEDLHKLTVTIKNYLVKHSRSKGFTNDFDRERTRVDLEELARKMKSDLAEHRTQPRHETKVGPEQTETAVVKAKRRPRLRVRGRAPGTQVKEPL